MWRTNYYVCARVCFPSYSSKSLLSVAKLINNTFDPPASTQRPSIFHKAFAVWLDTHNKLKYLMYLYTFTHSHANKRDDYIFSNGFVYALVSLLAINDAQIQNQIISRDLTRHPHAFRHLSSACANCAAHIVGN